MKPIISSLLDEHFVYWYDVLLGFLFCSILIQMTEKHFTSPKNRESVSTYVLHLVAILPRVVWSKSLPNFVWLYCWWRWEGSLPSMWIKYSALSHLLKWLKPSCKHPKAQRHHTVGWLHQHISWSSTGVTGFPADFHSYFLLKVVFFKVV